MSNWISLDAYPLSEDVGMNNGLTDVFISVLGLCGSRFAKRIDEKRLLVFLLERDQSIRGRGTVGFDISEMPWNIDTFGNDKAFMLKVIQGAKNKVGWELLDYEPNEEWVFDSLDNFEKLISLMSIDMIRPGNLEEWLDDRDENDPVNRGFPLCEKHHTLLTLFGCHLCNN